MTLATHEELSIANVPSGSLLSFGGSAITPMRLVPQLSRYSAVSVVALATDIAIYSGLCELAVNAMAASIVGYAAGMLTHYLLSSIFVFDIAHAQKSASRRFVEFSASGLLGLLLTATVIGVLTHHFAAPPIVAKAVAVIVSFFAVFLVRRSIVFAPSALEKDSSGALVYSKSGISP
ncbi:MAG: GtrA family protein [Hyphomicrobium sp.]